jgi:hypothetical protein
VLPGLCGGEYIALCKNLADTLARPALADEFAAASGQYLNCASGQFASLHPVELNREKLQEIASAIEMLLPKLTKHA